MDDPMREPTGHLCPSSPLNEDVSLLGVVSSTGDVRFLGEPLPVTPEFIQISTKGRSVGKRFRFTGPCMQRGCAQWNKEASQCGIARLAADSSELQVAEPPACGIREHCRWFAQEGMSVCRICPKVVHDNRA